MDCSNSDKMLLRSASLRKGDAWDESDPSRQRTKVRAVSRRVQRRVEDRQLAEDILAFLYEEAQQ